MKTEHSVSKRLHIKFGRRGITQKKEYNIKNTANLQHQIPNTFQVDLYVCDTDIKYISVFS